MTQPLPSDNSVPEDLPLRHRGFRAREAENIRQAFLRSRRITEPPQGDIPANPHDSNEQ